MTKRLEVYEQRRADELLDRSVDEAVEILHLLAAGLRDARLIDDGFENGAELYVTGYRSMTTEERAKHHEQVAKMRELKRLEAEEVDAEERAEYERLRAKFEEGAG